ncbi:hypothetical protein FGO68_gene15710 [Halteria grandinella]|uniref:Uncharacterized protein n=1 Tax=Halteria grandinella TaxID=5974 RepID=A0A8J8NMY5_HALGN|nr:hypothetical protein FGO68_gene15710 [Halteria grandinella]
MESYLTNPFSLLLIAILFVILILRQPKIHPLRKDSVVLITGGVQGLGKQIAKEFARSGVTRIAIIDIREDLAKDLERELKEVNPKCQMRYFNCDISNQEQLKETFKAIIQNFGTVNLLINNAARTLGKRISDLSFDTYRKTLDINFLSIVHLNSLWFQHIKSTQQNFKGYQLVHINSIGGTITSSQNADYCSSKFALKAYTDTLRQELDDYPGLMLTNFYPYFINTGLYEGFKPLARFLIPTLNQEATAKKIHDSILAHKKEVYIWWFIEYMRVVIDLVPLGVRNFLVQRLMGDGMRTFVGRGEVISQKKLD